MTETLLQQKLRAARVSVTDALDDVDPVVNIKSAIRSLTDALYIVGYEDATHDARIDAQTR